MFCFFFPLKLLEINRCFEIPGCSPVLFFFSTHLTLKSHSPKTPRRMLLHNINHSGGYPRDIVTLDRSLVHHRANTVTGDAYWNSLLRSVSKCQFTWHRSYWTAGESWRSQAGMETTCKLSHSCCHFNHDCRVWESCINNLLKAFQKKISEYCWLESYCIWKHILAWKLKQFYSCQGLLCGRKSIMQNVWTT